MSIYKNSLQKNASRSEITPNCGLSLQRKCACGKSISANGECAECNRKKRRLQRKATNQQTPETVPQTVHAVLREQGRPLDTATRAFMEPRFGYDFSQVRVHTDGNAALSANAVNARAYTIGQDVVFGQGQYAPGSASGCQLMAHELTHVVQQDSSASALQSSVQISQPSDPAEQEAETVSQAVSAGTAAEAISSAAPGIHRQAAPVPRRTIWVNVGFDSSARANEVTMRKLRASINIEKAAIAHCCTANGTACNVTVKTHYDWNRVNKPAPSNGDYDSDNAADRTLRDNNLANISGPANGRKVLVTESTLSQTWQGRRIFPRANTAASGILWNRALTADDTLAHESGHAAGYAGNAEGGAHSSDPDNLMASGAIRNPGAQPDANWCSQMAATAA